jgi:CheY-like chemotaxis protein
MSTGDERPAADGDELLRAEVQEAAHSNADSWATATPSDPDPASAHGQVAEASQRLRVLVVDDNQDAADSLGAVTELMDCEVRVCYDGGTALAAIHGELPDVLLLDLSMPRVSGLEVATAARALAGRRPLLLVATTALGSLEDRTETALVGFHYHLIKPISMDTLRGVLDRFRAIRAQVSQFVR